ncbi:hypothetical protein ACLMJK_001379 [Lecanora helva]
MYFGNGTDRKARAAMLIRYLVKGCDPKYGMGSLTCSIYDTAWVSMVAKKVDGRMRWLFPISFSYLLSHQDPDGGWQSNRSDCDGVLHTLAALLAICRHIARPYQMTKNLEELSHRRTRAIYFLETKFAVWNPDIINEQYEFNLLISKLLQLLESEGVEFSFRGKELIMQAREYSKPQCGDGNFTVQIRKESQVTKIALTEISHYRVAGSVNASPASTAEYLMKCSSWDDDAEDYLTHLIHLDQAGEMGGLPIRYPTTTDEIAGVITTLLRHGFALEDLGWTALGDAANLLEAHLEQGSGAVGFAADSEPDAISTANTLTALSLLGRNVSPQRLIDRFADQKYFKTYDNDQGASFATNCHLLVTFLTLLPNNRDLIPQIERIVGFICTVWWTTNGLVHDQSKKSAIYSIVVMVDAFMLLLEAWERRFVEFPDGSVIMHKVFLSLFQALTRTLRTQEANGSWEHGCREATAYAVIRLSKLASMTSFPKVKLQIAQAIEAGRKFLLEETRAFGESEEVWTGITTSGNNALHEAYILAALQTPVSKRASRSTIESHFNISVAKLTIQTKYHSRHTWFTNVSEYLIQASLIEAQLFHTQLKNVRDDLLLDETSVDDSYFESIAYAWVVTNNLDQRFIGAEFLYQMMVLSILTRRLEDYMRNVVESAFAGCLFEVEDIVHSIFVELDNKAKDKCLCDENDASSIRDSQATIVSDARSVLYRFISYTLNHPCVLMASFADQSRLRSELVAFLLGRIAQCSPEGDEEATDVTPHHYLFAFLASLFGNQSSQECVGPRRDFLETPEQQFLAASLCRHLSMISFLSKNTEKPELPAIQPTSVTSGSTNSRSECAYHSSSSSVSSASSSPSSYDDTVSPVSPISSTSSHPSEFTAKTPFLRTHFSHYVETSAETALESMQTTRLISHERRCLDLCLEGLLEAGVSHGTNNVLRLFIDATLLQEQILQDPNIGSSCDSLPTNENMDEVGTVVPPPVPPKRKRGSVSAARAALQAQSKIPDPIVQPLRIEVHDQAKIDQSVGPSSDEPISTPRMSQNEARTTKFASLPKPKSRAPSEVSRIESIMSEIDGIKLDMAAQLAPNTTSQTQSTKNSEAIWAHPHITSHSPKNQSTNSNIDIDDMKLAKVRSDTHRKLKHQAHKRAATMEAATQRMITKQLEELRKQDYKRRATYPLLPDGLGDTEGQARKLHRRSRFGGPRWKAPF